jgi:hypothetical protein
MPDLEFLRVRVTLGVAVEEATQQCSTGALDLGHEHEGLVDGHGVLDPDPAQAPELQRIVEIARDRVGLPPLGLHSRHGGESSWCRFRPLHAPLPSFRSGLRMESTL